MYLATLVTFPPNSFEDQAINFSYFLFNFCLFGFTWTLNFCIFSTPTRMEIKLLFFHTN